MLIYTMETEYKNRKYVLLKWLLIFNIDWVI
jgi:hypothetical protein